MAGLSTSRVWSWPGAGSSTGDLETAASADRQTDMRPTIQPPAAQPMITLRDAQTPSAQVSAPLRCSDAEGTDAMVEYCAGPLVPGPAARSWQRQMQLREVSQCRISTQCAACDVNVDGQVSIKSICLECACTCIGSRPTPCLFRVGFLGRSRSSFGYCQGRFMLRLRDYDWD
jgi:hypothetical protein